MGGDVSSRFGWFLLALECRLLNAVKVSRKTEVREKESERDEKGIEVTDSPTPWGPSGPRLIGSNRVEATTRKSHCP